MPDIYTESQSFESSDYKHAFISTAEPVLKKSDTSADELALEKKQIYTSFNKRQRKELSKSNRSQNERDRHSKANIIND